MSVDFWEIQGEVNSSTPDSHSVDQVRHIRWLITSFYFDIPFERNSQLTDDIDEMSKQNDEWQEPGRYYCSKIMEIL